MRHRYIALLVLAIASDAAATCVWIDTDPAIGSPFREVDDGFALVLAFHSPELRIAGISTTYGNASCEQTTRVARELAARFGGVAGVTTQCLFRGAAAAADLGRESPAFAALQAQLQRQRLTYLALGPLTNLATAIQRDPAIQSRIDRVIVVAGDAGGALDKFGRVPLHDANIFKDPAAARLVLNSQLSITAVGLKAALTVNHADLGGLRGASESGDFLFRNSRVWFWFWRTIAGASAAPVFDAGAVMVAAQPRLAFTRTTRGIVRDGNLLLDVPLGRSFTVCNGFHDEVKPLLLRRLREETDKARERQH